MLLSLNNDNENGHAVRKLRNGVIILFSENRFKWFGNNIPPRYQNLKPFGGPFEVLSSIIYKEILQL